MSEFEPRTIHAFTGPDPGIRLVDATTGEEIMPGQTIPDPYGPGHITYVGPTVASSPEEDQTPRPGRAAVVRYTNPETDWVYRPAELNARYEDIPQLSAPGRSGPAPETVTVRAVSNGYVSEFTALPGKTFGPWDMPEMIRDLTLSALLSPPAARDLVMDASANGTATAETNS